VEPNAQSKLQPCGAIQLQIHAHLVPSLIAWHALLQVPLKHVRTVMLSFSLVKEPALLAMLPAPPV
jgi:hypothetical protein